MTEDKFSQVFSILWFGAVAFMAFLFISSFFGASAEYDRLMGLKEVCEAQGGQFLAGQYGTQVCFPEKVFK